MRRPPHPSHRPHPVASVALFLAGLLLTSWALRAVDALPFHDSCRPKALAFQRDLDTYDTLFVGSSRVHRGVIPAEFDARMAALGRPTHSFNLGLAGLRQHDFDTIVDWVLTLQHPNHPNQPNHPNPTPAPHPTRIFLELNSFEPVYQPTNFLSGFQVEIHTLAHLPERLTTILTSKHPIPQTLDELYRATAQCLANGFRIGQGPRILDDLLGGQERRNALAPQLEYRGYEPLEPATAPAFRVEQHKTWIADPRGAAELLAEKRRELVPAAKRGGLRVDCLRRMAERVRAAGIELVFVVMPTYSSFQGRDEVEEVKGFARVLECDVPAVDEGIYRFEYWFDSDHLLPAGAAAFSSLLAEKYSAELGAAPPR